ncbi:Uncharacterised protein [uncultured archaeon]|nr:Uncharacterised protein [uncultured archaeon]
MPLIPPKKFKGRTIHFGERALVQRVRGKRIPKGTVARFGYMKPKREQEPVKEMFYKFKIAKSLFPKNFILVRGAFWGDLLMYGEVLLSKKTPLDALSKNLLSRMRREDTLTTLIGYNPVQVEAQKRFFESAQYKTHAARVESLAKPAIEELKKKGIIVSDNPLNVWFDVHGNPVFFDVLKLDSAKIIAAASGNARVNALLKRYNYHLANKPKQSST